ncbi:hypothetical protein ACWDA3_23805 [Nonomuraea rubra]
MLPPEPSTGADRDQADARSLDADTERALDDLLQAVHHDIQRYADRNADPTATLIAIMAADEAGAPHDEARLLDHLDLLRQRIEATITTAVTAPAALLARWEQRTTRHAQHYMSAAPLTLLGEVTSDLEAIQHRCGPGPWPDRHRRLCRITAKLTGLTGMLLINLGHQDPASAFFTTARAAADRAADPALQAWATVRQALVSHYYGDPRETRELALTATALAGDRRCAATAMAPVTEARALARTAQHAEAVAAIRSALARGQELLAETDQSEQNDPVFGYTRRQMLFHSGEAMAELGLFEEADDYLNQALELYSPSERLDRTLIQLDRAYCQAASGETEQAVNLTLQTAESLPADYRTRIIRRRAHHLEQFIGSHNPEAPVLRAFQHALAQL